MTKQVKAALIGAIGLVAAAAVGLLQYREYRASVPLTAQVTTKQSNSPFPFALDSKFYPSGWMGDGKYGRKHITLEHISTDVNGKAKIAVRIEYRGGPESWAGIYWQHPDGNWGDQPGTTLSGAREITFVARGEQGGEVVEFKSGGIRGRHSDSYERSLGKVALPSHWQDYRISLSEADLSSAIGAFAWVAPAPQQGTLVFYLADIEIR